MLLEKEKLKQALESMTKELKEYNLPTWDEIPCVYLYMDQVISLLNNYLHIYYEVIGEEKYITKTMINNYVKLKYIPSPVKKKYSKTAIAYLIIIFTLKETHDMSTIIKLIPYDATDDEAKEIYDSFVKNQKKAFSYVTEQINAVANPILKKDGDSQERMNDIFMQISSSANIFKLLTQRIANIEKDGE